MDNSNVNEIMQRRENKAIAIVTAAFVLIMVVMVALTFLTVKS